MLDHSRLLSLITLCHSYYYWSLNFIISKKSQLVRLRILFYFFSQEQDITNITKASAACTEQIECHKEELTVKEAQRAVSSLLLFLL